MVDKYSLWLQVGGWEDLLQLGRHRERWQPIELSSAQSIWWRCWFRHGQSWASSWVALPCPWPWPQRFSSNAISWLEVILGGTSPTIWTIERRFACPMSGWTGGLVVGSSNAFAKQPFAVERAHILASGQIVTSHVLVGCFDLEMDSNHKISLLLRGGGGRSRWIHGSGNYSPMPKFLGLFSKRGFTTFLGSDFLTANGAGATFLLLPTGFFFLIGCKETKRKANETTLAHHNAERHAFCWHVHCTFALSGNCHLRCGFYTILSRENSNFTNKTIYSEWKVAQHFDFTDFDGDGESLEEIARQTSITTNPFANEPTNKFEIFHEIRRREPKNLINCW